MFCYKTFVPANSANQALGDKRSLLMAVQRVANSGVAEMEPGTERAGVDFDAVLCQRSGLQQCAEVVGMAQLAPAFVLFGFSVFAGHVFLKPHLVAQLRRPVPAACFVGIEESFERALSAHRRELVGWSFEKPDRFSPTHRD